MSDESKGRWVVVRSDDDPFLAWTAKATLFGIQDVDSFDLRPAADKPSRAAFDALADAIEAAESTEPRNQPEPLPTMTGDEIAAALEVGRSVERLWDGRWVELRSGDAKVRWWRLHLGLAPVVARVVEPPAPATRTREAQELRPGMVLAAGGTVRNVSIREDGPRTSVDVWTTDSLVAMFGVRADQPVEVLTEGTDKP